MPMKTQITNASQRSLLKIEKSEIEINYNLEIINEKRMKFNQTGKYLVIRYYLYSIIY